ncbi:MAG TPA: zinc-dependent metalloprotease, partial [Chloroflexota bacterium]|nr:zinc-dependent metalloprotease [Chloroflexota bacterium]
LLAGALVGVAWVGSKQRQYAREGIPRLIEWGRVRRTARQIVKEEQETAGWHESWSQYYRGQVERCYPIVTQEMGRDLPAPVDHIVAFTRTEWIDANIANFRELFEPIEGLYLKLQSPNNLGTLLMGEASQAVLSSQLGVLMGYLSRRVLGQYDLSLLGKEPVTAGRLYFVEPNIAAIQNELALNGDDFRLWIALHETTHAFEFEAYPWVREYFNTLLEEYIQFLSDDLMSFGQGFAGLRGLIERARGNVATGENWIEFMMSPEQRALFAKLQALMSLVEGYSNFIMNAVGERLLPSYQTISERIEQRAARRSPAEKLFVRITGLDLKMEQYRLGESFIKSVVAAHGLQIANRVWEGPEMVPSLEELRNPRAWVERVVGVAQ